MDMPTAQVHVEEESTSILVTTASVDNQDGDVAKESSPAKLASDHHANSATGCESGSSSKTTGSAPAPQLMEKIDAKTDVTAETVFSGSDIPLMGVLTDHQAELEKAIDAANMCDRFREYNN
jgi:hypothetical protein